MERLAVIRLSLPGASPGATRDEFWISYWQLNRLGAGPRDTARSHEAIFLTFGGLLSQRLSSIGYKVEVTVRAIRYGSIELLLALTGGEELLNEMFWTVLEFYAPEAFNQAVGADVPLQAGVTHGRGGGGHGGVGGHGGGHGVNRALALARAPVILFVLLVVVTVGLMIWKIESLEREYIELHHDYSHIVGRIVQQNGALANSLMSKLGIVLPPEKDESKNEEKLAAPAHPTTTVPAPAAPSMPASPPAAASPSTPPAASLPTTPMPTETAPPATSSEPKSDAPTEEKK
jgi:hypothetical protein